MRAWRLITPVQKVGPYSLIALVLFALVFAFLPTGESPAAKTGAILRDVQLTLYPSRDPDAIWQFKAGHVSNDPITSTTELTDLSAGERLIREKNNFGKYTGQNKLDATLTTGKLTIDGQDNIVTPQAQIYLLQSCAAVKLEGTAENPVRIEQGMGFITPLAVVDSPGLTGRVTRMRMTFDFVIEDSGMDSTTHFSLDPTEECVNGKRVPIAKS